MAIIPWKPFKDIDKWFEEDWLDFWNLPSKLVAPTLTLETPRMDIYEKNGKIVADVEMPNVDPKNINVEVKDNFLKVEARKEEKKEEKKKGYYRKEISSGYYKRVVPLPVKVKEGKAEATYSNGLLRITIPKAEVKKGKEKKVKIKVKKS